MEISKPNEVPVSTWDRTSVHSLYPIMYRVWRLMDHAIVCVRARWLRDFPRG